MRMMIMTDTYRVEVYDRAPNEKLSRSRVYVTGTVVSARDEKLRELQAAEEALPQGKRFSTRGADVEVDKLYDRMNRRYANVAREIALEAVRKMMNDPTVMGGFSRYAGCSCGCSPGVVLDRKLRVGGQQIDVSVSPLPEPEHVDVCK